MRLNRPKIILCWPMTGVWKEASIMSKNSANNNMPYSSNDASDRYFGSNAPKIIERDEELRRFGCIKQRFGIQKSFTIGAGPG